MLGQLVEVLFGLNLEPTARVFERRHIETGIAKLAGQIRSPQEKIRG
jgi:hypothetical protein